MSVAMRHTVTVYYDDDSAQMWSFQRRDTALAKVTAIMIQRPDYVLEETSSSRFINDVVVEASSFYLASAPHMMKLINERAVRVQEFFERRNK